MRKALLLLITAITITLLTPNRALIDLNINKGETWKEPTLIAPFDIPILKSREAIEIEKNDIKKNYKSVFSIDTLESNSRIESIVAQLAHNSVNPQVVEVVRRFLSGAYSVGVLPDGEAVKYNDKVVRICDNRNNIVSTPTSELYTPAQIIDQIGKYEINVHMIENLIKPNLSYNEKINKELQESELATISTTRSTVRAGEVIITHGQVVDQNTLQILRSYRLEYEDQVSMSGGFYLILLGRFLLILALLLVNYQFFTSFANLYFGTATRPWVFIMMLYTVMAGLIAIVVNIEGVSPFIVPLPIVAIYLMNYFNMRVAILGNVSVAILGALFVRIPFDFFLVNFIAGMVGIFMMRHHYHRNNLFKAVGAILLTQIFVYLCVSLLREGDFASIKYTTILWFIGNLLLILGFYQLIYLFERIFGFVSDVTLLELSDTNQTLLMQLAEKAPGTFQHSVQVANLAEAAANEIKANALLARTGSLYHDIGKMENPYYFAENMSGGFNPHNEIPALESADIIRKHVTEGVLVANKNSLPKQIIDFISSHHGTSKMFFFYSKQLETKEGVVDESRFCYPGPRPVAKEVAIVMMADAVEAASRSLPTYDKETINNLVDKIIDIQIAEHQLSESELSFREVEQIKALFKAKLNTIYHARISYPERKK